MAMEEIIARLGLDSSVAQRGLDAFQNGIDSAKASVVQMGERIAAVFTVGALLNVAKEAIQYASDMQDAADATRTGVEEYQVLAVSARESGASLQQLDKALIASTLSGEKAAEGSKEMRANFAALNIDVAKFNELPTERKLETIGAAYNEAGRTQEAYAAICDILGTKSAPRLIAALEELGSEGFDAMRAKAEDAGLVLSKLDTQNLDHLSDSFQNWKTKGLVYIGEVVAALDKLPAWLGGKSVEQINNEEADAKRIKERTAAIKELVDEGVIFQGQTTSITAGYQNFFTTTEAGWARFKDSMTGNKGVAEANALIEEEITSRLQAQATIAKDITVAKTASAEASKVEAQQSKVSAVNADVLQKLEEGRAILKFKAMSDAEKLLDLERRHADAVDEIVQMESLGEGTAKEKQKIVNDILDIEKQMADVKASAARDEKADGEKRLKIQNDLLDLTQKAADIQAQMAKDFVNTYGFTPQQSQTTGAGGQSFTALANDIARATSDAQRNFDQAARFRLTASGETGDAREATLRAAAEAEARAQEADARRTGLETKFNEAQGKEETDPQLKKLEDVRKEIEKLREKLGAI